MANNNEKAVYDNILPKLKSAEAVIAERLIHEIQQAEIPTLEITHRIKQAPSALEKLKRKAENYSSISDLTDLIGFRIICYFSDDVDKIAAIVEKLFVIDRENSVDKRQTLSPTAFGYLSLHYICSLPQNSGYPDELCNMKFEIQMRSSLQHTWAEIEHDLGYKSVFSVPREIRREFSRIAGLLELADESFVRIRCRLNKYTEKITEDIQNGNAAELPLDLVTLNAYLKHNAKINALLADIAAIQGAAINEQSPENYLPKLEALGISTLGALEALAEREYRHALEYAERLFSAADLDEIASTAALHFLCRAEILYGTYSYSDILGFFKAGSISEEKAVIQANRIMERRRRLAKQDNI